MVLSFVNFVFLDENVSEFMTEYVSFFTEFTSKHIELFKTIFSPPPQKKHLFRCCETQIMLPREG